MATNTTDLEQIAHRWRDDVWNDHNLDILDELVAEDFVGHDTAFPEPLHGPDEYREAIETYLSAFPDTRVEYEDLVLGDSRMAIHWRATGTHEGELFGIEPTGKEVTVTGISIEYLEDGKVTEEWQQWDMMGLMAQLGVVELPTE